MYKMVQVETKYKDSMLKLHFSSYLWRPTIAHLDDLKDHF